MSGPATSYQESVGSCGPPTPPTPAPSAPRGAPVRRQLDFTGGGDLENDDNEELLCRVDDIERGYGEAKRRAPPCVCGRGLCLVERDDQSGQWKYVCPSWPKCNHVTFFEEVYLNPKSEPTARIHAKSSNPCASNDPSNHMASLGTAVNVGPQVTGTATPVSLFVPSTPAKFIPQAAVPISPVKVSPQGARSNEEPVCLCRAGKCKKSRIGKEDWYVCPIPKGKGACSYKVLVCDFAKDIVPSAQATPGDEVHPESPSLLHWQIAAVNTPSKSPMRPSGTPSPISLKSNDICFRCHEKGHWSRDCPKQTPRDDACFKCGMVGHWMRNCPQL